MRVISLIFILACGDKDDTAAGDTGTATPLSQGVSGEISKGEYCDMPSTIDIWTAKEESSPCSWRPEFDTGFAEGSWTDNVGEVTDSPSAADGTFRSALEEGDYEARYISDCYGCVNFSVAEGAVTDVTLDLRETMYADAPNIYLYPMEPTGVSVRLSEARHIVAADPDYPTGGWQVMAMPDGQLYSADGPADFLFYEITMAPGRLQRDTGWCIEGHLAQASIEASMAQAGFLYDEIVDFSDFWDAYWPDAEWMTVYPQTTRLGALRIHPQPDNLLRLWFVVEDGCAPVEPASLPQVPRQGFHAAEWGVVFDRSYGRAWDLVQ